MVRAQDVVLEWRAPGLLVARADSSGVEQEIVPDAVGLLDLFSRPCDPAVAARTFVDTYSTPDGRDQLAGRVEALIADWQASGILATVAAAWPDESRWHVADGASRWMTVPDFFDQAGEMRAICEQRFSRPPFTYAERAAWEYVSTQNYRTLQANPADIFPSKLYSALQATLSRWSSENLGCPEVLLHFLNCHLDGCWYGLHADVDPSYDWVGVFSLTSWDARAFTGGETILLAESTLDYWRDYGAEPRHEHHLLEAIEPRFNQLTVFDPRIPHGVRLVRGAQTILQGRLTINVDFGSPRLVVSETIQRAGETSRFEDLHAHLTQHLASVEGVAGTVLARLDFPVEGDRPRIRVLANSLRSTSGQLAAVQQTVERLKAFLREQAPSSETKEGWVNLPIRLPLPAVDP